MNAPFYLAAVAIAVAPGAKAERRCGWLDNPTPANWSLVDRHGEWLIGVQGGYQASGVDAMPDMSIAGHVAANGNYGYSCACMVVAADRANKRITRIFSAWPVPLRQCRSDRRLPRR